MAKKGSRQIFGLMCAVCKYQGYISEKNKVNTPDKLVLKKYCKRCKKRTEHKETTKLK
ncbi:50S ribosomal protein L33 [Candidatus Amesbacteria bacterium]|nr:50S ribosomal protein L33 [Candidatus Amesbacteria bacterium]